MSKQETITQEQREYIRKRAYYLYQLDWMMRHNYSLCELASQLQVIAEKEILSPTATVTVTQCFDSFERSGFAGAEIYACYEEFLECEYAETEYMEDLFNVCGDATKLKQLYRQDVETEEESELCDTLVDVIGDINDIIENEPPEEEQTVAEIAHYADLKKLRAGICAYLRNKDIPFA